MRKRWSVRTYLWLLALAVAAPCAGVLVYSIASDAAHDERQVEATTLSLAQAVGSQTQQFLSDAESIGTKLCERPLIRALDPSQRDPVFDQFLDWHPQFANLTVRDATGRLIHSAKPVQTENPSVAVHREWIEAALRTGGFVVGKPALGQVSQRWVCTLGFPIRNQAGQPAGALGMSVDLARFRIVPSQVSLPPESAITIVDKEGTVIIRSPGSRTGIGKPAPETEILQMALAGSEGHKIARGADGEERIYGFTTIPSTGWRVYVGIPTKVAFASARASAWQAALVGTPLLLLMIGLVLTLGRRINEPVRALSEAAAAAAEGRPGTPVPVSGPKEIAAVAEEFNRMAALRLQKEAEVQKLQAELEHRVQERTAQLEVANRELEAFSYSVSHDLRAPLRGIDGFSKALLEDYAEKLDESGRSYLERVRASVRRMSLLIDDLLKLSRISRAELRRGAVDLSALAGEIAAALRETAPERAVTFVIQPGLAAQGDARLLRVVLENLLNNAWKFTRNTSQARIEFGAAQADGQAAFFVRDNGAGFDMSYRGKLFGAFQRLHAPEDYEGTGIGLATVQRIVHRHGGRAWGEGEVDHGATFYFTVAQ